MSVLKKLCSLVTVIVILINTISAFGMSTENASTFVGYLLDEDFTFLSTSNDPNNVQLSGWDTDKSGGSFSYSYATSFTIKDTSSVYPVTMKRKFIAQNDGVITLEYRFLQSVLQNDESWQLRDDANTGIEILTSNGYLCYMNSSGQKVNVASYSANVTYGVKVVANISSKTFSLYINGALCAGNIVFKSNVSKLDNIFIKTGEEATGNTSLSSVCIYKGYIFNEKFRSSVPGSFIGSNMQALTSGGSAQIVEMLGSTRPDVYSLLLNDTSTLNDVSIGASLSGSAQNSVFEYKFMLDSVQTGVNLQLKSQSQTAFKLTTTATKLRYVDYNGIPTDLCDLTSNLWYSVKAKVNYSTGNADIYVNGRLRISGIKVNTGNMVIDEFKLQTPQSSTCKLWVDDILFYNDYSLPSDYPTVPTKLSTGDYIVGMQSCSLWREGHHLGWDRIKACPEREPYLGYYDEGNPETADWEIKWLAEHGITYEMFCWYRPPGGSGPIKDPFAGFALHDGYFNSRYSDKLNYAIAWENGASKANNSDDFRNNIVPFWIEYYFKDPRYQKIDNKPVLSIYSISGLERDFGSTGVAAEITYLKNACIAAGFNGVVLLGVSNSTTASSLQKFVDIGTDALYSYSWGSNVCGNAKNQENITQTQSDLGVIDILSTISMGRDDSAWGGNAGKYMTPGELKGLAKWTKESFMPSLAADNLGKKMVMLDNLNEYGEGHFMMPSKLAGFGYLDSIGQVFGGLSGHSDIIPTQNQKERINVLYPQDRVVTTNQNTIPQQLPYYKTAWQFTSSSEGFSVLNASGSVSNGYYNGTATTTDPIMQSADNLNINIDNVKYIKVRMKNSSKSSCATIYFMTSSDTAFSEVNSVKTIINSVDGGYTDYIFDMYKNANWKGTLRRLRVDPIDVVGDFSVDYIALLTDGGFNVGENLINDSSFEGATFHYIDAGDTTTELTKTEFKSGGQSLMCTKNSPNANVTYAVNLKEKVSYYYTISAKLPLEATENQVLKLCASYNSNGIAKQKIIGTTVGLTWSDWKTVSGVFTIEDENVSDTKIYFSTDSPALAETYYVDDFELREITQDFAATPQNNAVDIPVDTTLQLQLNDPSYVLGSDITVNTSRSLINSVTNMGSGSYQIQLNTLEFGKEQNVTIKNIQNIYGQVMPAINIQFATQPMFKVQQWFYKNYDTVNQEEISSFTQSTGDVSVVANVTNNSDANRSLTMYVALYNNGKLIKVYLKKVEIPLYGSVNVEQKVSSVGADSIKQFVWDDCKPFGYKYIGGN